VSADDQAIMEKYLGETMARSVAGEWDRQNAAALAKMKAAGISIKNANPAFVAAVEEHTAQFTEQWLDRAKQRGVDGPAALAFYKQQLKDFK